MAKYLLRAGYSRDGLAGLIKEGGSGRRDALEETIAGVGGTLDAFYYAFGECDLYMIADLPDNASAAAVSLAVSSVGAIDVNITVLLTPETVDEAVAKSVSYRPPGA